jgi:uncharacterized protein YacL
MEKQNLIKSIFLFCILDIVFVGMGMGIPIVPIILGGVIGWFIPKIIMKENEELSQVLQRSLYASILTSIVTMIMMIMIWGPIAMMLFDKNADIENFGIPLILFEPKASFIGWIILMIIISPILQMLTTLFGSVVRIAWKLPKR